MSSAKLIENLYDDYNVHLSISDLVHLKDALHYRYEISGCTCFDGLNWPKISEGDESGQIHMRFSSDQSFHTHPQHFYDVYDVNCSWFSTLDMLTILRQNKYIKAHFVVAVEGIYAIHWEPAFIASYNNGTIHEKKEIERKLHSLSDSLEKTRFCRDTRPTKIKINSYLNKVNKFYINGIKVMTVKFYSW